MPKKTVLDFTRMKEAGEKIVYITSYDYPTASAAQKAGVDMILVGDSLGMVVLGYDSTVPVTMDDMIRHTQAVRRGAPHTFVIGDMPFMSYQGSIDEAVKNAGRFIKEGGADAIKLEGGARMADRIRAITDAGILVMGHIGLTPQNMGQLGGFKAQGRDAAKAKRLVEEAGIVEDAGAFAILVEAVPPIVARAITERAGIPILSIGAGPHCDGQLLIWADMVGLFDAFTPKFVKKYANVGEILVRAFEEYAADVRSGAFPGKEHTYSMPQDQSAEFERMLAKKK